MALEIILSSEHAGNEVPDKYQYLFKGKESELYTHKAIDFGALDLARRISETFKRPLYYTTISRLLVEANRSEDSPELFSEFSKPLPEEDKKEILKEYYHTHRNLVEKAVLKCIEAHKIVIHIAVHTFTPALDGEVRDGDIGILFDPARSWERNFYDSLKKELLLCDETLSIKENFPYSGADDGFSVYMRKKFPQERYIGIELEVNQKFFLSEETDNWENIKAAVASALLNYMNNNRK